MVKPRQKKWQPSIGVGTTEAHRLVLSAMRPEGCTARPVTSERCPASVLRQSQLGAAHTVMVPSALQE